MRVFVSPVLIPSSTSRRVDIHLHHTRRVAVAFARWNFLLRAAKKKQRRKIYCLCRKIIRKALSAHHKSYFALKRDQI